MRERAAEARISAIGQLSDYPGSPAEREALAGLLFRKYSCDCWKLFSESPPRMTMATARPASADVTTSSCWSSVGNFATPFPKARPVTR